MILIKKRKNIKNICILGFEQKTCGYITIKNERRKGERQDEQEKNHFRDCEHAEKARHSGCNQQTKSSS